MLGETVREARIKKNFTQARLAKLAGVSRRHLAALEKGANVSISILQRVAAVLELTEINLGDLSLRAGDKAPTVNLPLLSDTIREARAEAVRAQAILARAEDLLGHERVTSGAMEARFPQLPVRLLRVPRAGNGETVHDGDEEMVDVVTAGEIRHGEPVNEKNTETVTLPKSLVDDGEIVFRARGDGMRDQGIHDGDLLIVENRPRGRAFTGELVIGRIGRQVFVGRWWQKHGHKALMSDGQAEVTLGRSTRSLKIVAAINQVIRY